MCLLFHGNELGGLCGTSPARGWETAGPGGAPVLSSLVNPDASSVDPWGFPPRWSLVSDPHTVLPILFSNTLLGSSFRSTAKVRECRDFPWAPRTPHPDSHPHPSPSRAACLCRPEPCCRLKRRRRGRPVPRKGFFGKKRALRVDVGGRDGGAPTGGRGPAPRAPPATDSPRGAPRPAVLLGCVCAQPAGPVTGGTSVSPGPTADARVTRVACVLCVCTEA